MPTGNNTPDDQMRNGEGRCLKCSSHDDKRHCQPHHTATTHNVTDENRKNAATESAQTIA